METESRLHSLEQEVQLLKGELKQVLVDLREALLSQENPFAAPSAPANLTLDFDSSRRQSAPHLTIVPPSGHDDGKVEHLHLYAGGRPDMDDKAPGPVAANVPVTAARPPVAPVAAATPAEAMPSPAATAAVVPSPAVAAALPPPPAPAPITAAKTGKAARAGGSQETRMETSGTGWSVLTMASLAKWVDLALRQLGRQRFEAMLDVYELANGDGALSPDAKKAILRMARLTDAPEEQTAAGMNAAISLLAQLDSILQQAGHNNNDAAALSILTSLNQAAA